MSDSDFIRWHKQDAERAHRAAALIACERDGAVAEMHKMAELLERTTTERNVLRAENEKLRAIMLDLIVFGSAAIDEEEPENHEAAATVLGASIKQARILLGLHRALAPTEAQAGGTGE